MLSCRTRMTGEIAVAEVAVIVVVAVVRVTMAEVAIFMFVGTGVTIIQFDQEAVRERSSPGSAIDVIAPSILLPIVQ